MDSYYPDTDDTEKMCKYIITHISLPNTCAVVSTQYNEKAIDCGNIRRDIKYTASVLDLFDDGDAITLSKSFDTFQAALKWLLLITTCLYDHITIITIYRRKPHTMTIINGANQIKFIKNKSVFNMNFAPKQNITNILNYIIIDCRTAYYKAELENIKNYLIYLNAHIEIFKKSLKITDISHPLYVNLLISLYTLNNEIYRKHIYAIEIKNAMQLKYDTYYKKKLEIIAKLQKPEQFSDIIYNLYGHDYIIFNLLVQ